MKICESQLKAHAEQSMMLKDGARFEPKWEGSSSVLPGQELTDSNLISAKFGGLITKEAEKEHYDFLNELRITLNVDSQKLIDLEARITCK